MRNMYVDDCLVLVDIEEEVIFFIKDLIDFCKKGGFCLIKWISNCVEVLKLILEDDRVDDIKKLSLNGEILIECVLGVYWFVENDFLGF